MLDMKKGKTMDILKVSKFLLFSGLILVIVSPYLLTRDWTNISFIGLGDIGDTIGGITAPITSLIGSVLVFFALKAQIDANKAIQDQIETQKTDEKVKRNIQQISELYNLFLKGIDDFSLTTSQMILGKTIHSEKTTYYGLEAIEKFVVAFPRSVKDPHEDEYFDSIKMREFYSLIYAGKYLLEKILKFQLPNEDQSFYFDLISNQFHFRIMPIFNDLLQDVGQCSSCGDLHGPVPVRLYSLIEEINVIINKK
jgi:hypothetical protein